MNELKFSHSLARKRVGRITPYTEIKTHPGCTTNLVEYSLRRDGAINWIRSEYRQFACDRLPNAIEIAVQLPALDATS